MRDDFSLSVTIKLLADRWPEAGPIFLDECRRSLDVMLQAKSVEEKPQSAKAKDNAIEVCLMLIQRVASMLLESVTCSLIFERFTAVS